jgi:hypothetical protein
LDRIGNMTPRSSLIVTDEPMSSETGKGTEFVVLLSGEPQGGIKKRRRSPGSEFRYAHPALSGARLSEVPFPAGEPWRAGLTMSVVRGRPEVAGIRPNRRD